MIEASTLFSKLEPDWTDPSINVQRRIAAVMSAVSGFTPDGEIAHGSTRYKYITERQVTSEIRKQMIKFGLVIYPASCEETLIDRPSGGYITRLRVQWTVANVYGNDSITVESTGQGYDAVDKGSGKASTNAYKYMLFRLFMIPQLSDDPDDVASDAIAAKPAVSKSATTSVRIPAPVLRRQGGVANV